MMFKSNNTVKALHRVALTLATMVMLTACEGPANQTGTIDGANIKLSPPSQILQSRAIDSSKLDCVVTVNGQSVAMTANSNSSEWTGTVVVPENQTLQLEMRWIYESLPVAIHSRTIDALTTDASVSFTSSDYTTQGDELDFDLDGYSNLEEFDDEFDPRDANNPGATNIDVVIPWISPSDAPAIDGLYDITWNSAGFQDRQGNDLLIDNLMIDLGAEYANDMSGFQWAGMHDGIYLYIFVFAEEIARQTPFADSQRTHRDDALSLYLDGDNSKLSSYDGVDDLHMVFPFLKLLTPAPPNDGLVPVADGNGDLVVDASGRIQVTDTDGPVFVEAAELQANNNTDSSAGSRVAAGDNSVALPADFQFASCLCREGVNTYEIKINLAQAGIVVDRAFGIDLHLDDDNDGGNRDARYGWAHPARSGGVDTDLTWRNPSIMGTAILD